MNYTLVNAIADNFGMTTGFLFRRINDNNKGSGLRLMKIDAAI